MRYLASNLFTGNTQRDIVKFHRFISKTTQFIILSLGLIYNHSILAKEIAPVFIDENFQSTNLGEYIEVIEDKENTITIEKILTEDLDWKKPKDTSGNFGFNSNYFWIRFSILNSKKQLQNPILELAFPRIDYIELYKFKNGKYERTITGDTFPFKEREIDDTNFVFELEANYHTPQIYYIRTKSVTNISFINPKLYRSFPTFHKEASIRDLSNGLLYGFLTIMIFYNLLLFLIIREKVYFYLSIYISSFLIILISLHGIAFQYFYPENTWLANKENYFLIPLLLMIQIVFITSYLELKKYLPLIYTFMRMHLWFDVIHLILIHTLFANYPTIGYYSILVILFLDNFIFICVGSYLCYRKFRPAYFFMISWILLLIGNIIRGLLNASIIPANVFTFSSFQFGLAAMLILISIGLADKINYLKRSLQKTNKKLEDYSDQLEQKISERTSELQSTLDTVNQLRIQQDGDYFLTSLLLEPFIINNSTSEKVKVDFLLIQKKKFEFYGKEQNIGGDLCHSQNLVLNNRNYILFFNSDAMGKSLQGAGGAIVFGSVFFSIIERTKSSLADKNISPERWLKNTFIELHKVFLTFDCTMLVSAVIGLVEEDTGVLYFINSEHPSIALYGDNVCNLLEKEIYFTKLGSPVASNKLFISLQQLHKEDSIFVGSDGRDDFALNDLTLNQDEKEFLYTVQEAKGDLKKIYEITCRKGILIDDFSLMRITYLQEKINYDYLRNLSLENIEGQNFSEAINYGEEYISKNPIDSEFLFRLGQLYKQKENFTAAIKCFERLRLRNPYNIENQLALMEALISSNNFTRAKKISNETEKIASKHFTLLNLKNRLKLATEN
ncbi:MAG TPA: 7TM diverse intracellular signaling domain-containing protein [Leptospiraceae bacterium]|nr:7TM diverse intracellular signaling domain-containing protein [Leptospiraceae bacterium]